MFLVLYEVHLGVYYVRDLLRELDEGEHRAETVNRVNVVEGNRRHVRHTSLGSGQRSGLSY